MRNIKHLFAVFLLLIAVRASASDDTTLVLKMRDGSTTNFLLAEKPVITFTGEFIKIVSEYCTVEFYRSSIRNFYFSDEDQTAIVEVVLESKAILEDNILFISDVPENTIITIYTIGGTLAAMATAIDGNCSISLDELATGPYIVSFNNTTFKFLKK